MMNANLWEEGLINKASRVSGSVGNEPQIVPDNQVVNDEPNYVSGHTSEQLSGSPTSTMENDLNQSADFLSFYLGNELYGVAIHDVEEIRVWEAPTPIPCSPNFVKGVINLRGMIVPVVDLRARFSIGNCEYLPTTVVLVLRHKLDDKHRLMGVVVDSVSDVVIQGNQEFESCVGDSSITPYLFGMLNVGELLMAVLDTQLLLDINLIFGEE